jgi:hypothetical protein
MQCTTLYLKKCNIYVYISKEASNDIDLRLKVNKLNPRSVCYLTIFLVLKPEDETPVITKPGIGQYKASLIRILSPQSEFCLNTICIYSFFHMAIYQEDSLPKFCINFSPY